MTNGRLRFILDTMGKGGKTVFKDNAYFKDNFFLGIPFTALAAGSRILLHACLTAAGLLPVSCYTSVGPNPRDGVPDVAEPDGLDPGFEDPAVEDFGFEDLDFYEPDPVPDMAEDIVEPDINPDLEPGTCTLEDLVYQSLCGPGFKCTIGEAVGCMPSAACRAPGPQGENEFCLFGSEGDNCRSGYYCFGDLVEDRCRKFCSRDYDCHGGNSGCLIIPSGPDCPDGLWNVKLCSHNCDYFYQTGCHEGQACRVLLPGAAFQVYSDCTAAGPGAQGASCPNGMTDCAAGFNCFAVDDGLTVLQFCLKLCNYTGGYPACDSGYVCQRGVDWPPPIGACL